MKRLFTFLEQTNNDKSIEYLKEDLIKFKDEYYDITKRMLEDLQEDVLMESEKPLDFEIECGIIFKNEKFRTFLISDHDLLIFEKEKINGNHITKCAIRTRIKVGSLIPDVMELIYKFKRDLNYMFFKEIRIQEESISVGRKITFEYFIY